MIILLLVTANDIARMALEGERNARGRRPPETPGDGLPVTQDVLLTLSLLLGAALAARFLASLLRIPEILVLVLFGALLGPSALDVVDVPLDSIGAQLLFTLGVSHDPLLRRAQPLAATCCGGSGSGSGCWSSRAWC